MARYRKTPSAPGTVFARGKRFSSGEGQEPLLRGPGYGLPIFLPLLKIFFQAKALPMYGSGGVLPYIAVVSGLVDDPGDPGLVAGIAEDEAELPAVLHQPLLSRRGCLSGVQRPVAVIHDIHHQAGLMFAGAGNNGGFGGFRFHRFPGIPCFIRTSTRLLKRDSCFCCVR